uniref:DUS-like FMN-binding domain-containing protein n=1 Tax=Ditylum brightwellii TaxID=49249 RepID=A0A7S4S253_9STRA
MVGHGSRREEILEKLTGMPYDRWLKPLVTECPSLPMAVLVSIHISTTYSKKITSKSHLIQNLFPAVPSRTHENVKKLENFDDVKACLRQTKADGVMSSESILEYPPLFTNSHTESTSRQRTGPGRIELSRDYIQYAKINPPNKGGQGSGLKCIRVHIHRFLHADLQSTPNIRDLVCTAQSVEELEQAIDLMEKIHNDAGHVVQEEQKSWYVRHRVVGEDGLSAQDRKFRKDSIMTCDEPEDDSAICVAAMFGNDDNGDY